MRDRIRHFQLLATFNRQWNDSVSNLFFAHLCLAVGIMQIFSTYASLRFVGRLLWTEYIICPLITIDAWVIAFGVMYLAGMVETESRHAIAEMRKANNRGRFIRRRIKCLRPFGVITLLLPVMKKMHFLGYLYVVSNQLATMVIEDSG